MIIWVWLGSVLSVGVYCAALVRACVQGGVHARCMRGDRCLHRLCHKLVAQATHKQAHAKVLDPDQPALPSCHTNPHTCHLPGSDEGSYCWLPRPRKLA